MNIIKKVFGFVGRLICNLKYVKNKRGISVNFAEQNYEAYKALNEAPKTYCIELFVCMNQIGLFFVAELFEFA